MKVIPANELENHIGEEVGVSDWFEVTQERINQFAEATNDHQFIHVILKWQRQRRGVPQLHMVF